MYIPGQVVVVNENRFPIKTIVWDWDETIQVTDDIFPQTIVNFLYQKLLQEGAPVNIKELSETLANQRIDVKGMYQLLHNEHGIKQLDWGLFQNEYCHCLSMTIERAWLLDELPLIRGSKNLLEELSRNHINQILISNGTQKIKSLQMVMTNMRRYFQHIYTTSDTGNQNVIVEKHEVLKGHLERTRENPVHVAMFGDSKVDIDAAKMNGCLSIGIAHTQSDMDRLASYGADVLIYKNYLNHRYILDLLLCPGTDKLRAQSPRFDLTHKKGRTHEAADHSLIINGGRKLSGEVSVGGSKHSSLMLLGAVLLVEGRVIINNFPHIDDAINFLTIYAGFGVDVHYDLSDSTLFLDIDSSMLQFSRSNIHLAAKFRSSVLLMASALVRLGSISLPIPGGDSFGRPRALAYFFKLLEAFGIQHNSGEGGVIHAEIVGVFEGDRSIDMHCIREESTTLNGTACAIILAAGNKGTTRIDNLVYAPEIIELVDFLRLMGVQILQYTGSTIELAGKGPVYRNDVLTHELSSDRPGVIFFMIAGILTKGEISIILPSKIDRRLIDLAEDEILHTHVLESIGIRYEIVPHSEKVEIRISGQAQEPLSNTDIEIEYGFNPDSTVQLLAILVYLSGESSLTDDKYGISRFLSISEALNTLGAKINTHTSNENSISIKGVSDLAAGEFVTKDIRAAAIFLLTALTAAGLSRLHPVRYLERGYHDIISKLIHLGADIEVVDQDDLLEEKDWLSLVDCSGALTHRKLLRANRNFTQIDEYVPGLVLFILRVKNGKPELLLQKRSIQKHFLPGIWDASISGHLKSDKSFEDGIYREFCEETLNKVPLDKKSIKLLSTQKIDFLLSTKGKSRNIFRYIYCYHIGEPTIDASFETMIKTWESNSEVEAWKWESISNCIDAARHCELNYSLLMREIFSDDAIVAKLGV